jgi:Spy/CpxP family protein refolding chaperone
MDISVKALQEAIAIRRQIDALEKRLSVILGAATPERTASMTKVISVKEKGGLTPAARRKLSQLMKARWAARKKRARTKRSRVAKKAALTPAGRKRLSQLMKARWAARRKAAGGWADAGPGPGRWRLVRK